SSHDQFGCQRCAVRRHVRAGIGNAHEQSRGCSERPRARPKRALCMQSVPVLGATELLPPFGLLRLQLFVVLRLLLSGLLRLLAVGARLLPAALLRRLLPGLLTAAWGFLLLLCIGGRTEASGKCGVGRLVMVGRVSIRAHKGC